MFLPGCRVLSPEEVGLKNKKMKLFTITAKSCQRIGKTTACAYIKIIIKNVEKLNLNKEITYCKLFGIFFCCIRLPR